MFEGRFIGYDGEYVEFFLMEDDGSFTEVPVKVAEDGTFRDTVDPGRNIYDCALFADKFMFRICFEQGRHYVAEFDLTTGSETDFRFFGDGEAENAYLARYWRTFRDMEQVVKPCESSTSFEDYLAGVNEAASPFEAELATIGNPGFVKYYEHDLDRLKTIYLGCYPVLRIAATGKYEPEKSYLQFIRKTSKFDDSDYRMMLNYIYGSAPYFWPDINLGEALRAAADFGHNAERRELAVSTMIESYLNAGANAHLKDAYEVYKSLVRKPDAALCEKIENALTLGPGVQAPEIEFEDIDGKVHHLSDFAGKPLYIDLWASWCRPCCAEIPHLAKLVEELGSDPEIVCISISIDSERSDWTAKLAEGVEGWPQFIATANGMKAISEDYGVSGIPRFLLLDAEGKIVSVNAPRPSTEDILENLKNLLEK